MFLCYGDLCYFELVELVVKYVLLIGYWLEVIYFCIVGGCMGDG